MNDPDIALELEIQRSYEAFIDAETPADQGQTFAIMRDLIARRSPKQVEQMEREKGLR